MGRLCPWGKTCVDRRTSMWTKTGGMEKRTMTIHEGEKVKEIKW
ncbi:WSSV139 [White spot syndrome virus]|uniref:WSSV139 n=1 Tax=White spot syndrome virus TaxID=342409 RepID=A0A2I6SBQ8_9VIRU|nr:WSSV139 [White spot syndrome virus]